MTRGWEIIRAILLRLESAETPNAVVNMTHFDEFDEQAVAYNMRILKEANCIEAKFIESHTGDNLIAAAIARKLTPLGHDLLDAIRNDTVWSQIRKIFASKGLDMSIDMVVKVGKRVVQELLV